MGNAEAAALASAAQRAAGVVAARRRGDHAGAETLLASFPTDAAKAAGFCLLADLTVELLRRASGQSTDELVQELTVLIEQVVATGP